MEEGLSRFIRACYRQEVDYVPIWFMRQAGRYMAEYRALREKYSLLTLCKTPELAVEVTLQPIRALGVDAAILFADILLPLESMGIGFDFAHGEGPVIHNPVRSLADVQALRVAPPEEHLGYVFDAIRMIRAALSGKVPLIGFAGAPFTLASYMIEGGHSRNYIGPKLMMRADPGAWSLLMTKLATVVREYLLGQIRAGAQAVQLFDSWVGCLSPADYQQYVAPYVKIIFDGLRAERVPLIHFGAGTATLLDHMKAAGGDVIGIDWRVPMDNARSQLGPDVALQGNLDPVLLMAPRLELERAVRDILRRAAHHPGYIFNLGHGILPQTPVDNVKAVVDLVHAYNGAK
ncbi:MAG: uroporphyrinogen decarboxylase [Acidobacteria bacterium]|nr:uroporphyrinogen decarboxylase [Acidobacteriota bacterium]MBI3655253.1 uroporphyrinogen decarboxylase [Acidobacteriota bacterium]